jgi:hypothetical protein
MNQIVVDRTEHEPTDIDVDGSGWADGPDEKPISFDFKLRLGSRDTTAALADRGTGELVQLQPIDWDSFTGLRDDGAPREYKTEGDLPSIIVELANHIALAPLITDEVDVEIEAEPQPDAVAEPEPEPVTEPEPEPVAEPEPEPEPQPVAEPEFQRQLEPADRIELPQIVLQTPDTPSGQVAMSIPAMVPADQPVVQLISGSDALALATSPPRLMAVTPAPEAVPAPAPTVVPMAPLQLAKIERRPGAERPTKPVDFHALLGEAGLQPASKQQRRRKKRHPFRALFKLIVVLAVLSGAAYAVKTYYLDMRWDKDLEPFADDVADARDLQWDSAVDMQTLPLDEYAQHLVTSALGAGADGQTMVAEWRAMGLAEGDIDIDTVSKYAASIRPVMYDPTDATIYRLEDVPANGDLHDYRLYQALDLALLDQHFHWSEGIDQLGPAERAGRLALVQGDAATTVEQITRSTDSDRSRLATQITRLREDIGVDIAGAADYPVALLVGADGAARDLFADGVVGTTDERNELFADLDVDDGDVLDSLRGLDHRSNAIGTTSESAGMAYWYYALAGRLPDADAWNAAVAWDGDQTTVESVDAGDCVAATISTLDGPGHALMLSALQRWAAAAPPESVATVTDASTNQIQVRSCDPGTVADTKVDDPILVYGFSAYEYGVIDELDFTADVAARECTINGVRNFGVLGQLLNGDDAGAQSTVDQVLASCASA